MKRILAVFVIMLLMFSSVSFADGEKQVNSILADDITHLNETISDAKEYFAFSKQGDLIYDNSMAMICRLEKIKIERRENNQPVVEIGIWKLDDLFSTIDTLRMNICKEIMKYYAKEDADGDKIFAYVDQAIKNNKNPDASKVLKFGNTTVGFGENEQTKKADMIIKLDSLMFGPKSIDDIPTMVEGNVKVIDITNIEVPHYQEDLGRIRPDRLGSVDNAMMGTRPNGSSYEEDIALFNKALGNGHIGWKVGNAGSLEFSTATGPDDPNATFKVKRDEKNRPLVQIRNWDRENDTEASMPSMEGMTMNMFMEVVKYYSKSSKDGEAIYWYVDKAFKARIEVATGETYLFGKTKVKITDPEVYGIDVIFID